MIRVRLSLDIEQRLDDLVKASGRKKTYYARETIIKHLYEIEDVYLAKDTLDRIRRGDEHVLGNEDSWHGLED